MQILCCLNFPFHPEKDQKENFSPCDQHKMAGHTFQKIKCKLKIEFWKLVLSMSSIKYVVDKLHNRFTVSSHFVLTDKLSLTEREFCLLAHPHDETEI